MTTCLLRQHQDMPCSSLKKSFCGVQDAFDAAQVRRPNQAGPGTPDRRASGDQTQRSRRRDARGGPGEASAPRPPSAAQSPQQPPAAVAQPGTASVPSAAQGSTQASSQGSSAQPGAGQAAERQQGQRREGRPREDRSAKGESRASPSLLPPDDVMPSYKSAWMLMSRM